MGSFTKKLKTKLHIGHSHKHGASASHEYRSEAVDEASADHVAPEKLQAGQQHPDAEGVSGGKDTSRPAPAQLQMANAPRAPPAARKPLESGQNYTFQRSGDDTGSAQAAHSLDKLQKTGDSAIEQGSQQKAAHQSAGMGSGGPQKAADATGQQTSGTASVGQARPAGIELHPQTEVSGRVVEGLLVVQAAAAVWVGLVAIFMLALRVNILYVLLWASFIGAPLGVGYSWLLYMVKKNKLQAAAQLRITPGQKGLTAITGGVPAWVHFSDREKVRWFNTILTEVWPYYDKAVCAMVKETVEPIMDQYKPAGLIKKMYFKHLTFGDAPFIVENVWAENKGQDHVLMEMSLRWAGDPNIAIAVELPAGGDATRMVPRVTDIHITAVARVLLAPLVGEIPGFGAAVVSLRKPPQIKFKLNFGKALGSTATAKPIQAWLDPFLRQTLADMLVWPNRIVVPILPEDVTGPLDALMLRHKGVLQAWVMEAKELHKQDVTGKADPFVELSTRIQQIEKTSKKKNTLHPTWRERKWLMVQEPETQMLRVEMFDWDRLNLKEVLTFNIVQGIADSVGANTLMGRCAIPIAKYAEHSGQEFDEWFELGKQGFDNDNGCGKGKGKVRLKLRYMSLHDIYSQPRRATVGAVLLTLHKCEDLAPADPNGFSDPYVTFKLGEGQNSKQRSTCKHFTLNAEFNEKFEWFRVPYDEVLTVKVFDSDTLSSDELLGLIEIDIATEIAAAPNGEVLRTWYLGEVPPGKKGSEPPPSSITMHLQWVPWDLDEPGSPPV